MTASPLRFVAAAALTATLVLSLAVPAGAASPKAWTSAVCGALDTWVGKVNAASTKAAAAPKSAAGAKKQLTKLLVTTEQQTRTLLGKLKDAGKPDVKGGKQIAATVRDGFVQVQRVVAQARKALKTAPAKDPEAFSAAARTAQDALEAGLEGIQAAFSAARNADVPALVTAFASNERCQNVAA